MDPYPVSPFSDHLDPLLFSSDSSSPYSSSSSASSYPRVDDAPSPFASPFPPSFDTPLPPSTAASHSSWTGMSWPAQTAQPAHVLGQPTNAQQPRYYGEHTAHHSQQHEQHLYYPPAAYTATIAQSAYPSALQHPAPSAVYDHNHNPYVADHSNLLPHAVPALIIPPATTSTATSTDPHHPATALAQQPEPVPAEPTTPPPPPLKFGDVFKGASLDMAVRHSQPVRPLNHAQMRVWQQFESGDNVRSISDAMGLKPHVVLNYIIYALESYSPSPSHPIFLHWPRFSVPPELMERVSAAMVRVGGALGRMDVVKQGLAGGGALDEDVRIAMVRWKMERAVGAVFEPYNIYRVLSAGEAAERLARQRREDAGQQDVENELKGRGGAVEEAKEASGGLTIVGQGAEADSAMQDDTTEAKQPPTHAPATQPHGADKEQPKIVFGAPEPPYPPALTASEMLFQLSVSGGLSQKCMLNRFQRDWSEIEVVLNKLIAERLAWKRGLLYCPS